MTMEKLKCCGTLCEKRSNSCDGECPVVDIYDEIKQERERQVGKWGSVEKGAEHGFEHWYTTIRDYNGWARLMASMSSKDKYRRRMVQIAAIAVAAVEALDFEGKENSDGE